MHVTYSFCVLSRYCYLNARMKRNAVFWIEDWACLKVLGRHVRFKIAIELANQCVQYRVTIRGPGSMSGNITLKTESQQYFSHWIQVATEEQVQLYQSSNDTLRLLFWFLHKGLTVKVGLLCLF